MPRWYLFQITWSKIQNHPQLSTSFDKEQMEALLQRVNFLLDYTESYSSSGGSKEEDEGLARQIASAAHAAEDVVESHIVDRILPRSPSNFVVRVLEKIQLRKSCAQKLKLDLRKIMKEMDFIKEKAVKDVVSRKEKAMEVKEEIRYRGESPHSSMTASSLRSSRTSGNNNMVGFDDYLTHILEELTGDRSDRKIIPIVGMGGIGKTTLARNAYDNLLVVHYFDVRAWVTVSQRYNVRRILVQILCCLGKSKDGMDGKTEHELGEQLHKTFSGMRYLIVLDDMWSIEVWDEIKFFFPNNCNRSRVIVTTRLFDVAYCFGSMGIALKFLDDDHSWELFCEKVFVEEICPPELEEIGSKIVRRCQGLPLAIVVIGGLLANSTMAEDQWENVEKDMRSILYTDDRCSKLLTLSYRHLPACLKPCFLYFGIFPEDDVIRVSRLIKLWVAEGFIKPNRVQSLEEIGEDYIKDLVGRNLISVHSLRWNGKLKICYIHDLLRDLCVTVAEKENFLCATSVLDRQVIHKQRRIINHRSTTEEKYNPQVFHTLKSKSLARSLICKGGDFLQAKPRLLRVLVEVYSESIDDTFQQVNLRLLAHESQLAPFGWRDTYHIPSSISLLWNVQTLIMTGVGREVVAPSEIWKMPQLRHLKFKSLCLPDPPPVDGSVLYNLQALGNLLNFRFSEDACKRIPNIKKLHVSYGDNLMESVRWSHFCLHNFILLNKLESLHYQFGQRPKRDDLLRSLIFPSSLKKLTLEGCELEWNDFSVFGSLPSLEALKLRFLGIGPEWNPVEGEFLCLKYLRIYWCNLVWWNADSTHFPVLENLVLEHLDELVEIPSGIGDIHTLEHICLVNCSVSAALSAVKILEEQESLGNQHLQVKVDFQHDKRKLEEFTKQVEVEGLSGTKFQIEGCINLPELHLGDGIVLYNLQTFETVQDFRFTEEACTRMPKIKKLHVCFYHCPEGSASFASFSELESLHYKLDDNCQQVNLLQYFKFPNSLKKLTLAYVSLQGKDMAVISSLPNLEVLKLDNSINDRKWDSIEGKFLRLRFLEIVGSGFIRWNADNTHFPVLDDLCNLKKIPLGIGEIETLERISLAYCSISSALSALNILEEQHNFGNKGLQVKVRLYELEEKKFMELVEAEGLTGLDFQLDVDLRN